MPNSSTWPLIDPTKRLNFIHQLVKISIVHRKFLIYFRQIFFMFFSRNAMCTVDNKYALSFSVAKTNNSAIDWGGFQLGWGHTGLRLQATNVEFEFRGRRECCCLGHDSWMLLIYEIKVRPWKKSGNLLFKFCFMGIFVVVNEYRQFYRLCSAICIKRINNIIAWNCFHDASFCFCSFFGTSVSGLLVQIPVWTPRVINPNI